MSRVSTIHTIHGFNVKDEGGATTDTLTPILQSRGMQVKEHNYPHFFRLRVRLCNKAMATMIRDMVQPGDPIIAHSNGCAIVYLAAKVGAQFGHVTLVNPALDCKLAIPGATSVDVWYAPSDQWTNVAKYIPFSIWGAQGRKGFTGDDDRYRQINEDEMFQAEVGHSGMFQVEERRQALVDVTLERL